MKKIFVIPFIALLTLACEKDKPDTGNSVVQLRNPEEIRNQSELDRYITQKFTNVYNVDINYRYPEDKINRNQFTHVVPPSTEKALEMVNFLDYMYYQPYSKVVPAEFMQRNTPKEFTLVGSYAYTGTNRNAYNGLATGGVRIELLGVNDIDPTSTEAYRVYDISNNLLRLIYHESSHILEQTKQIPPDYERLSVADYKGGSFNRAWSGTNYLRSGFISAYASDNVHEDFVELIARYLICYQKSQCNCPVADGGTDADGDGLDDAAYTTWRNYILGTGGSSVRGFIWEELLALADGKNDPNAQYTGKEILERKLAILKDYMLNEWGVDLERLHTEIHASFANLPNQNLREYKW